MDGHGVPCDCDDTSDSIHPGAVEQNDGNDNQCPGDAGYGLVDEITGVTGFFNPLDKNEYSWPAQPLASRYHVGRAESADFLVGCTLLPQFPTGQTFFSDTAQPLSGGVFYYLAQSKLPNAGSWGAGSAGIERDLPCD